MRALIAAPLLGLTLLGGCGQPQYLLSERTDPAPSATTDSLRDVAARYTSHPTSTASTEVIQLYLEHPLTARERTQIVAAADEWNLVMNGAVRFDVMPTIDAEVPRGTWRIVLLKTPWKISEQNNPQPVTEKIANLWGGGTLRIYANRLEDPTIYGDNGLRGTMVHELGTILGSPAAPGLYTAEIQDCINKKTAMAVGQVRNLPLDRLNWCATAAAS